MSFWRQPNVRLNTFFFLGDRMLWTVDRLTASVNSLYMRLVQDYLNSIVTALRLKYLAIYIPDVQVTNIKTVLQIARLWLTNANAPAKHNHAFC